MSPDHVALERRALLARAVAHLRGNLVAYLALFVALGGTSYAALRLPRNSVGTKQIKNGAVTKAKLSRSAVKALAGKPGPRGLSGLPGAAGSQGPPGVQGTPGQNGTNATGGGGQSISLATGDSGFTPFISGDSTPPKPAGPAVPGASHTFTSSGNSMFLLSGKTHIDFTCPAASSQNCNISDGGVYVDGTPVPGTDPAFPLSIPPNQDSDSNTAAEVSSSGQLDNLAAGTHTLTVNYTQTQGSPVTAVLKGAAGYALIIPQEP